MLCSNSQKLSCLAGLVLCTVMTVVATGQAQAQTETVKFCEVPTTLPKGTPLPNYSPLLCFDYANLQRGMYMVKSYLLETGSGSFFCASNQWCGDVSQPPAVFAIDNRDGTNSSGKLLVARRMDIFDYPNFLWVADLINQAGNKAASTTQLATGIPIKAPVLSAIGDQRVGAGQPLEFTVSASDPGGNSVMLSAQSLPPGVTFDAATGRFRWGSPVVGVHRDVVFKATQVGATPLSDAELIVITVNPAVSSVSAASYSGQSMAPESIVAAFGTNLATATVSAPTIPLPTELDGTMVEIRDSAGVTRRAPLFFVSSGQVNYLLPLGTMPGTATITSTNRSGGMATGTAQIAAVSPGLFAANANGQGVAAAVVLRRNAAGDTFEAVAQLNQTTGRFEPRPINLGPETDQVFLILYGTGFRNFGQLSATSVTVGGTNVPVIGIAAAPGFVGLDQCNIALPRSLAGRGNVDIVLKVGTNTANTVTVNIM